MADIRPKFIDFKCRLIRPNRWFGYSAGYSLNPFDYRIRGYSKYPANSSDSYAFAEQFHDHAIRSSFISLVPVIALLIFSAYSAKQLLRPVLLPSGFLTIIITILALHSPDSLRHEVRKIGFPTRVLSFPGPFPKPQQRKEGAASPLFATNTPYFCKKQML
jgi:hypothetical protein